MLNGDAPAVAALSGESTRMRDAMPPGPKLAAPHARVHIHTRIRTHAPCEENENGSALVTASGDQPTRHASQPDARAANRRATRLAGPTLALTTFCASKEPRAMIIPCKLQNSYTERAARVAQLVSPCPPTPSLAMEVSVLAWRP
jgi:hypothetical protein